MPIRLKPINWRLLLLHLLSIPLLILGARQLALAPYAEMITLYQKGGTRAIKDSPQVFNAADIGGLIADPIYAWFLAILAGCALSALVVWHRRESKLLPVALFILSIVTSWTHYDESEAAQSGLAYLQWPFKAWPLATRLGIVGAGLLVLGCLPFLFTWRRPVSARN
ncbi:hypothetical protein FY528_04600 [Hymenobacter lutimineralis]|uniref:Uncharacterized protein n=1 Tax=Hymenobacter lutimineralis TaxID=2606448 RepID=A0A5D6VBL5_9BACT|nr:hypothetical protein [Hymenobacter lutimineralis]TYZ12582.1 hypothetical protein FY528_04600 [Hymenobacter lutimineralis]